MHLDNLLPETLAAFAWPTCLWKKLRNPTLVSFGLMANLVSARKRGLIRDIDSIIDVGANIGQYAYMAHNVWPQTSVFSFEPDPKCYERLMINFRRHSIPGKCFPLAVGAVCEQRKLLLQKNSAQSSFFARDDVPGGFQNEVIVQSTTLDEAGKQLPDIRRALLKIDTQGFEAAVLAGAKAFLGRCSYVQLEVAFRPSYDGQPYAAILMTMMREAGFVCAEILDILREPALPGRPITEADLLFARAA